MAALMHLGGIPIHSNPEDVRWSFRMKTWDTKCMGGKVIQILGTELSDITIRGHFGQGRKDLGDKEGWEDYLRLRDQVKKWSQAAESSDGTQPLHFTYTPQNWDFPVFVKSFSPTTVAVDIFNPDWTLVLFPVEHGTLDVVRRIKDLYIERLAEGVGWTRSDYNGPSQREVDDYLGGLNSQQYIQQKWGEAFLGGGGAASGFLP